MHIEHGQHQNLYQIPNCTICLNQMTEDIGNLNCGHVFHITCITQHFQYRGTCPNCQKRSHEKEIRLVVFPLQKNTQAARLMREVLGNLSGQQKQQVQVLFRQVQSLTQKNQRAQNRRNQSQKQLKKATQQLNQTKLNLSRTRSDHQTLKKDSLELKKVIEHLHGQIKKLNQENFNLRQDVEQYKEKEAEYEQVKKYRRIMHDNSQSLIDYKKELEKKQTSPTDMATKFFDMVMIKNLEVIKLKQKLEDFPVKLLEKDQQIEKLKNSLERQRKDTKDLQDKKAAEKKKYDDLKTKYRNLIDKYRAKCQELSDDDNYEDSMLSRPSFPLLHANNNKTNNNNGSNLISNNSFDENSSSNIPFTDTKINKKPSSNVFVSSIIEEEPSSSANASIQPKKSNGQQSLNNFLTQKSPAQIGYGTFGGLAAKKKTDDNKKPLMKNLFL